MPTTEILSHCMPNLYMISLTSMVKIYTVKIYRHVFLWYNTAACLTVQHKARQKLNFTKKKFRTLYSAKFTKCKNAECYCSSIISVTLTANLRSCEFHGNAGSVRPSAQNTSRTPDTWTDAQSCAVVDGNAGHLSMQTVYHMSCRRIVLHQNGHCSYAPSGCAVG